MNQAYKYIIGIVFIALFVVIIAGIDNRPGERRSPVTAKAYIRIETAVGKTKEVMSTLHGLKGVNRVDTVTGPYDIIATVDAENLNDIGEIVTGKIHPVAGIYRTVTCLAIKAG